MSDERDRLSILAHELRSPVAALDALAQAAGQLAADSDRRRALGLAVDAVRDLERLLGDPERLALERADGDLAARVEGRAGAAVAVRVDGRPVVRGDETRLRQLLANLVGNGLRHGTRVVVDVAERDGEVVIEVADDGPGVDPLEDPFARGVSGVGSTGIGLWLARAIAEAHGGTLDAAPPDGGGATFRLALPSSSAGG